MEEIRIPANTGRHLFVIRLPGLLNFRGESRKQIALLAAFVDGGLVEQTNIGHQ